MKSHLVACTMFRLVECAPVISGQSAKRTHESVVVESIQPLQREVFVEEAF